MKARYYSVKRFGSLFVANATNQKQARYRYVHAMYKNEKASKKSVWVDKQTPHYLQFIETTKSVLIEDAELLV